MTLVVVGLSHQSAPPQVLSELALQADLLPKLLVEVSSGKFVNEAVALSTCNRTEVYVDAERFHEAYHEVRDALSLVSGASVDDFVDHLYVHYHEDAIRHLFSVTAGLESVILGEHEILGQVRAAWDLAKEEGASGAALDPLFANAVASGKRVRTETAIGQHTASLSHAAVSLLSEVVTIDDHTNIALIGAGDVGASVAGALCRQANVQLSVLNRTPSRAVELATQLDASASPFESLPAAVAAADIVICATAAPDPVIDVSIVPSDRPIVLFDLAMPADVAAEVAELDNVTLLKLADLQAFANRGIERRREEAVAARGVVDDAIEKYRQAVSAREVAPLLGSMHRWADEVRAAEIDRYRNRLGQLDVAQLEAVEALTKGVVAKLLHPASRELRDAAGSPRGERLAETTRELFDLP